MATIRVHVPIEVDSAALKSVLLKAGFWHLDAAGLTETSIGHDIGFVTNSQKLAKAGIDAEVLIRELRAIGARVMVSGQDA